MLATFLTIMFTCQPVYKVYDVRVDEGRCLDITSINIVAAIWNGTTDFIVVTVAFSLLSWSRLSAIERSIFVAFEVVGLLYVASMFFLRTNLLTSDFRVQEHCRGWHQSPAFVRYIRYEGQFVGSSQTNLSDVSIAAG